MLSPILLRLFMKMDTYDFGTRYKGCQNEINSIIMLRIIKRTTTAKSLQ
jgi:hypothetical protein